MERKNGFSIAELLLGLLITMVVATAMVPVIGPKRVATPNQKISHGEFYCFYDDAGTLHMFTKNNTSLLQGNNGGEGITLPGSDRCVFNAPAASYYSVTLIGAGGDGGGYDNEGELTYTTDDQGTQEGSVPTVGTYSTEVQNLPEDIKKIIKNKLSSKLTAKYTLSAQPAPNGDNCPVSKTKITTPGNSPFNYQDVDSYWYYGALGGNGYEVSSVQQLSIGKDAPNVTFQSGDTYEKLIVGNSYVQITKAKEAVDTAVKPRDARCSGEYGQRGLADQGASSNFTTNMAKGSYEGSRLDSVLGDTTQTGEMSFSSDPAAFDWGIGKIKFTFSYGTHGTPGEVTNLMIPKLEAQQILAIPAKEPTRLDENNKTVPTYSRLVSVTNNLESDLVTPAISGGSGGILTKSYADMPEDEGFPQDLIDDVVSKKEDVHERLKIGNTEYFPGAAGSGGYPLMHDLDLDLGAYIWSYNPTMFQSVQVFEQNGSKKHYNGKNECALSVTDIIPKPINKSLSRCLAQRGKGGAVIIKW